MSEDNGDDDDNVVAFPGKETGYNPIDNLRGKENKNGRPPGTPNKRSAAVKDAIMEAGVIAGDKLRASAEQRLREAHKIPAHDPLPAELEARLPPGGRVGYMVHLAEVEPKAFAMLISKLLPVELKAEVTVNDGLSDRLARARERVIEGKAVRS